MGWLRAGGYEVALDGGGRVVCRNARGKVLKAVPPVVAGEPAVLRLRQLADWLARHERACRAAVERWMIRSLPLPAAVPAHVWPDPAWRAALRDLVVTDAAGTVTGFLREASPERGIGLVDLDGDTVRVRPGELRVPHPVLLPDLAELREFAAELDLRQGVGQLHREVWHKDGADPAGTAVDTFAGARFRQGRHLAGRAAALGYRVRGGQVVCPVFEGGRIVEARVWCGAFEGGGEAETGPLTWTDPAGRTLRHGDVGPVAWSEGMRMAAALHAGADPADEEGR
jgi:hypothetical protein